MVNLTTTLEINALVEMAAHARLVASQSDNMDLVIASGEMVKSVEAMIANTSYTPAEFHRMSIDRYKKLVEEQTKDAE
ncbi:hypothetical protein [Bacillus cereus]|uniref:Phage protein n=1 Tax=Bacillus cereus TIAC219 TaxID=718222 RepID=A0ABC9SQI9_BACCE|nr:hypothetical protein [Bacillus cereus]EJP81120.1 hypothetical protein IC1_06608 [Bacillus cereus VD022]EOQ57851.1 hypothetical protein IAY_06235 [Bacillus cereus TIAC219]